MSVSVSAQKPPNFWVWNSEGEKMQRPNFNLKQVPSQTVQLLDHIELSPIHFSLHLYIFVFFESTGFVATFFGNEPSDESMVGYVTTGTNIYGTTLPEESRKNKML